MTSVIQPILEKGIVDHSIIHRMLMEYFSIADQVLCLSPINSALFVLWPKNLAVVMPLLLSKVSLWICEKSSVTDIIQQLSSPLLVRMIGTRDGAKLGILCVKHGSAKVLFSNVLLSQLKCMHVMISFWHRFLILTFHFRKGRRLSKEWKAT